MSAGETDLLRELIAEVRKLRRAFAPDAGTFSLEETMEELGCSESRVYRLLKVGKLVRAKKAGRHSRITVASVRAYQLAGGEAANEKPNPPKRPRRGKDQADHEEAIRALKV